MVDQLKEHLSKCNAAPFLFIGSGFSRRYLGLDTWAGILSQFAVPTGRTYEYYATLSNSNYPTMASLIADSFHDVFWSQPNYRHLYDKYASTLIDKRSPLKVSICEYIIERQHAETTDPELEAELELLKQVEIDGIITTNWDQHIESLFDGFATYIGQEELLFSSTHSIGEIYKIHGCVSNPNSIILTAEDYADFDSKNAYLAAKLLTVFVEHPVLFLGYSMADKNIQKIIGAIAKCLSPKNIEALRDRLIFVDWDPNCLIPTLEFGFYQIDGQNLPIAKVQTNSYLPAFEALAQYKRPFPAQILRRLKEHVYELVRSTDPASKLYVQDIDKDADLSELEVVFGVGVIDSLGEKGYTPIERRDLLLDAVLDNLRADQREIVTKTLPSILKNGTNQVPMFKHLRTIGALNDDGIITVNYIDNRLKEAANSAWDRCSNAKWHVMKSIVQDIKTNGLTISDVERVYGPERALQALAAYDPELINPAELKDFAARNVAFADSANRTVRSRYAKLTCLVDCLLYRKTKQIT